MIIIKNMDMPNNCVECEFEHFNRCQLARRASARVESLDRPDWCPLGEISDGLHGHRNPEDAHREDFGGASHE